MNRSARPGEEFVLRDGTRINDLAGLYEALGRMSEQEFAFFVNARKNDFANWIEHSINDRFLAAAVRRATSRELLRKTIFISLHR